MLILVAVLSALIAAVAGGLVGYSMASGEADQQAAVVTDLRDELADVRSGSADLRDEIADIQAEKAVLEDRLTSSEDQVGACVLAASLAQQIIENRQADLEFLTSPNAEDPLDPGWDEIFRRDEEFKRLVGQFDVAAAACVLGGGETTSAAAL